MGHATACAAALAVQRVIERDDLLANVRARGEQLRARLREVFADHPNVGDIRGRGLFVGVEFVQDRAGKAVLDPVLKTHARLKRQAMENGLMMYPMGGTIDGVHGDHVLLAPPFICTASDIDRIVELLDRTVRQVLPA
jgi:adenosylmethionine-8-amino-7-oxononanoate aminotransferase